jgi:tripartite-type tricarboxylate transporter receptor subunit TctC
MTSFRIPANRRVFTIAAMLSVLAGGPLAAQTIASFPERPVRLVVPYLAGGGADAVARTVADRAAATLGQPIVVENRPGVNGNLAAMAVAKSTPDGYTLLFGTQGTHIVNPALYKNPGFDPVKDFAPVTRLTRTGIVLVVPATSPLQSLPQLVKDLKDNPGKRSFGTGASGQHIVGELFKSAVGVDLLHVPYKGNAAAMVDLLGGRIDMMFDVLGSAYPQVKAGKLRALAILSAAPEETAPEIPTIASFGFTNIEAVPWDAVFAPAGTPGPVVDKLNAAFRAALADPTVREALLRRGATPAASTPEEMLRQINAETPRWAEAVRRSGAKIE